ncbi:dephospho-CoA kinase [Mesorhizobium koreense]|jgi:dephospho-CoA kinase|uniref:dephospho-CoA kinase n=1 Tax=Mesorhizobium koreense TaxID=3074855 RepID=UPI00287B868D|nr:dephospho-CoA kinase [Mesorhizobium sp. WR6]
MIVLGLTGSIGMGKSTAARMFMEAGVPVHDSDEVVHRLYSGKAAPLIEHRFPGTASNGVVDREKLAKRVLGDPEALKELEAIVHPLVREDEKSFLREQRGKGATLVVLDIPLLFEVGAEGRVDKVVVVSAPAGMQRERVLARPGMTEAKFEAILKKQVPDAEKRRRADYVIDSGRGMEPARLAVERIVEELTSNAALDKPQHLSL